MIKFQTTYNGRKYGSIAAAMEDMAADEFRKKMKALVSKFEPEIRASGGSVHITGSNLRSLKLEVHNIPESLKAKINAALKG